MSREPNGDDTLRRYLDGELPRASLSEKDRAKAESWDRLLEAFRVEAPSGAAPDWLEDRIMAEVHALPEPGIGTRVWRWLARPQAVTVRPAAALLAAAAVAALLLVPRGDSTGPAAPGTDPGATAATVVYVQFSLQAPSARSVSVGGDFDAWEGAHPLEDPDGDGVWTGRIAVEPGVHDYMFLVDGSEWVTDPGATRYSDDGFGNRNAVLAVSAPVA